jgi:nucleotide-binding universal stress UspA family protein
LESLLSDFDEDDSIPAVRVRVTFGDPVKEILKAADEIEADWIVMGVGESCARFHFRDRTAYMVTAAAHCPVLALRHTPSK